MDYTVYRQIADGSFLEMAKTVYLFDAEAVLKNWESGMITHNGVIMMTKQLVSPAEAHLFKI